MSGVVLASVETWSHRPLRDLEGMLDSPGGHALMSGHLVEPGRRILTGPSLSRVIPDLKALAAGSALECVQGRAGEKSLGGVWNSPLARSRLHLRRTLVHTVP